MTALEIVVCAALLVAVQVWALWPDIMRWIRDRGADRRPGYIYDQERER